MADTTTIRREIEVGGRRIGIGHPPFLVAEAGINHNGDVSLALAAVRAAKAADCDAIKFGMYKAEEFVGDPDLPVTYLSQGRQVTEPMFDMFKRCELSEDEWRQVYRACGEEGILFFSTAQNKTDFDFLMELGVDLVKVGSDDLTNTPMLKSFSSTGLPIIFSAGMANLGDVHAALEAMGAYDGYPVVLLHCTSEYPTPPEDVHLRKMRTLADAFPGLPIGYSDHTDGNLAAPLAVALGACYVEKHFTLDHDLPGPDHHFSADPVELGGWAEAIRTAHTMLGSALVRPTVGEREMIAIARRSVVALADIEPGQVLTSDNIGLRRPGTGLPPAMIDKVLGRTARRGIAAGAVVELGDFV